LTDQRRYRDALALLDSVPDTPDNFSIGSGGFKPMQQANLYWLMGDMAQARPLYAKALPLLRGQIKMQQGSNLAFVWQQLANTQIGLGQTAAALDSIGKSLAVVESSHDQVYGPLAMVSNAELYAQVRRPELAVPLLAKALATPGVGSGYAPVMLWLDPLWDPIRNDPGFQALLQQYAKDKPAVIYDAPTAAASP
ncbi:MAG: tetratricopeptide repeat protein, partial [Gammaproteobacteria bacterium]|nr:tetratricopeptide repeat protein [Gammaproteobacteria bacterium]